MPVDPTERPSPLLEIVLGGYLLALAYGTLYPLGGWHATGQTGLEFMLEPWPRWWTAFDVTANVLVYALPGALGAAMLRRRTACSSIGAALLATLAGSALSLALEAAQSFLPARVPSRLDWIANTAGTLAGAMLQVLAAGRGRRLWRRLAPPPGTRDGASAGVLLGAWLVLQMHPQRLLFGSGELVGPVLYALEAIGLPLSDRAGPGGAQSLADGLRLDSEFTVLAEAAGTACAMVAVGLIIREAVSSTRPRAAITGAVIASALAIRSLADLTLLGPGQAFAWLTAGAQGGLVTGAVLIGLMASGRRRARLGIAMGALAATAALACAFPADAYHESMLARWDQGAWRNVNGMLRGLAAVWPLAAIAWCVRRRRALGGPMAAATSDARRHSG